MALARAAIASCQRAQPVASLVRTATHALDQRTGEAIANAFQINEHGTDGAEQTLRLCAEQNPGDTHQGYSGTAGHLPAFGIVDHQDPCLPLQAQSHGFGLSCVHHAQKVCDRRFVCKRCNPQPTYRECLANSFGAGPTGFGSRFPMNCWRNHAVAEQAWKQLQPLDSGQRDQRASVGGERQMFGKKVPRALSDRRLAWVAHRTARNSSSRSEAG